MFIHPAIFWTGLVAAGAPILIHLLNRRRYRVRDWAAMQFLLESVRRNRRRVRIEELILLLLRTLVVILLALGLARFTGCSGMDILPGGDQAGQSVVFLLDNSYSMGQRAGDATLLARARTDLGERLSQLPRTDKVAVLLATTPEETLFPPLEFNADPASLANRVMEVRPAARRAQLAGSLAKAADMLQAADGVRRIYLLSDFRRTDLTRATQGGALAKVFERLRNEQIELIALDYALEPRNNLTIQGLELVDKFAVARIPARVRVSVRNNSPRLAENVQVRLTGRFASVEAGEVALPVQVIDAIEPGATRSVEVRVTAQEPGSAVLRAEIAADELPGDNQAQLALHVREAIRALVVEPGGAVAAREHESFYLTNVVDPYGDQRFGLAADVITAEQLSEIDFEAYDLIFLLNVRELPLASTADGMGYPAVEGLEDFVRAGGGLVIFTGPDLNLAFYNGRLYNEGAGLSPLRISPPAGDARRQDRFVRLDPESITPGSVLDIFTGDGAAFASLVRFYAYTPAEEAAAPTHLTDVKPPRILARFTDADGSPAVAGRQFGQGEVLMFYSTASTAWNDWPIEQLGTYPAVIHRIFPSLARSRRDELTAEVGEPIVHELSRAFYDAAIQLQTPRYPAEAKVSLVAQPTEGRHVVRYQRAGDDGVYILELAAPSGDSKEIYVARNGDPVEGELAPGGQANLSAALGPGEYVYQQRSGQAGDIATAQADKDYWLWALSAVVALLALETFLGQRFGHYSGGEKR